MSDDGTVDSLPPQGPVERDTVHEEGVEEGNATPRVAGSVASTVLLEAESSIDEPSTSMSYQSTPWEGQTNESLQEILIEREETSSKHLATQVPTVTVGNPEKHGEGFKDAYVTYEIVTEVPPAFYTKFPSQYPNERTYKVRRRYQDFLWLLSQVGDEIEGGMVVPPIPEKNRLGYMDRFSPEFIKKRQQGLTRFLQRILLHPRLSKNGALRSFLTTPVLGIDESSLSAAIHAGAASKADGTTGMAAVVERLSDVVINAFSPSRPIAEEFAIMKRTVVILETHLDRLASLKGRLIASFSGLSGTLINSSQDLSSFSTTIGKLEQLVQQQIERSHREGRGIKDNDDGVGGDHDDKGDQGLLRDDDGLGVEQMPLMRTVSGDYAQLLEERSSVVAKLAEDLEIKTHLLLIELAQYCRGTKHALRLRDQRQSEWMDLKEHLRSHREESAALLGGSLGEAVTTSPASNVPEQSSSSSSSSAFKTHKAAMMNFLTDKFDSIRGLDPVTMRAERVKKLEGRIAELETALSSSMRQSEQIDDTIREEYATFIALVEREIAADLLPEMANAWMTLHQQDLSLWQSFVDDSLTLSVVTN